MFYVQRDGNGNLLRVENQPFTEMTGELAAQSDELQAWLKTREEVNQRLQNLQASDMDIIRIVEDVVAVLVNKGVIQFTDLPQAAQEKLDRRAIDRADIEGLISGHQQLKQGSGS